MKRLCNPNYIMHSHSSLLCFGALALAVAASAPLAHAQGAEQDAPAKNAIFFVGDGMGVSTVTATRIFSVGIDGHLTLDQAPFTALSQTYTSDHITPDSAGTMTAMMTGVNTNSGVIGFGPETERQDFLGNGDGPALTTVLELAKAQGKMVGVISTARITHATPAACYAKSNERNEEEYIALQALPTDAEYNLGLGSGIDLLMGGGRRFFVPDSMVDEEGSTGRRTDGRDLRAEFQAAGYTYVYDQTGFDTLTGANLPILGLFESSHMEYEYDRLTDLGGEPSLEEMVAKAVEILEANSPNGYFLMVESGRIDHAHHAGNAYRALVDTEEFDAAINAALQLVNLGETLVMATADHSHVFNIAGYPLRPQVELPYPVAYAPVEYMASAHGNILNTVFDINASTGGVEVSGDLNAVPYTALLYGNGPGHRGAAGRVDPWSDATAGYGGVIPLGPEDPAYMQEAAVPLSSETHAGEEVAIYAWGPNSHMVRGTGKNTGCFRLMKRALGL